MQASKPDVRIIKDSPARYKTFEANLRAITVINDKGGDWVAGRNDYILYNATEFKSIFSQRAQSSSTVKSGRRLRDHELVTSRRDQPNHIEPLPPHTGRSLLAEPENVPVFKDWTEGDTKVTSVKRQDVILNGSDAWVRSCSNLPAMASFPAISVLTSHNFVAHRNHAAPGGRLLRLQQLKAGISST